MLACIVWGKEWSCKKVVCHCDNMAVVEVLNNGYSKDKDLIDKDLMYMLCCLFFISEFHGFMVDPGSALARKIKQNSRCIVMQ